MNWQTPATAADFRTGSAPALATLNGVLHCVFRADDPTHAFRVTSTTDGVNWAPPNIYQEVALGGDPSLTVFNGTLFCAFQADDGTRRLSLVTSDGGGVEPDTDSRGDPDQRCADHCSIFREARLRVPDVEQQSDCHIGLPGRCDVADPGSQLRRPERVRTPG